MELIFNSVTDEEVGDMVQLGDGRAAVIIRLLPGQRAMVTPDPGCLCCNNAHLRPLMGMEWLCSDPQCGAHYTADELKRRLQE